MGIERMRQRSIFYLQFYSLDACNEQGSVRLKPEVRNFIQVSHVGDPSTCIILYCSPRLHTVETGLERGTGRDLRCSNGRLGVPSDGLTHCATSHSASTK